MVHELPEDVDVQILPLNWAVKPADRQIQVLVEEQGAVEEAVL